MILLSWIPKFRNSTHRYWQYFYSITITSIIYSLYAITFLAYNHPLFEAGLYIITAMEMVFFTYSVLPSAVITSIILGGLFTFSTLLEVNFHILSTFSLLPNFIAIHIAMIFIFIIKNKNHYQGFVNYCLLENERNRNQKLYDITLNQNKTLVTQNFKIEQQKNLLSSQFHEIEDSLKYASNIQSALLPSFQSLTLSRIKDAFLYNRPKHLVSGDFHWHGTTQEHQVIATGDCTGHGVPGALMSMLGISLLDRIVNTEKVDNPKVIIERLHREINHLLKNTEHNNDGMALSIICVPLDTTKNTLTFAGAKSPLLIIKNEKVEFFRGSRYYIGGDIDLHEKCHNNTVNIEKDMLVYMYSDGFEDQFGGEKNKKYKAAQFRTLLQGISHKTCNEQKIMLEQEFKQWKDTPSKASFQVDDVLVMGLRF
ncbi:PP2C family protein-serine/threonine phosphatase [Flammeovirga agarivorans]|uniref:SpoIIE family protein phosphatase n=1 Tax=Flammeovirga agarivorans TaxID=2726742 RepID=A0A7X8SJD9_9BACT|nr:SpoIIE family protein phosphatase [Flammeovirga agarivorans]NLR91227.1 SpoIIE family protein phosphatase [Flammeovirga agarivorans]